MRTPPPDRAPKVRADASGGGSGESRTSASTATGRSLSTSSGFTSISAISGMSAAMRASASTTSARAPRSTAGAPRNSSSRRRARIEAGQLLGLLPRHGRERKRDIAEHLGQHAAEAERDHGAEGRVALHAGQQLAAAGHHRLDQHTFEGAACTLLQQAVRRGHLVGAVHAEDHEAAFGLVKDRRAHGLHGQLAAEALRRGHGVRLTGHEGAGWHRDAVRGQQRL